jgi:hypothetical protein
MPEPPPIFSGEDAAMAPKASVLLPLYVYPSPGAWDPLYQMYELTHTLTPTTILT